MHWLMELEKRLTSATIAIEDSYQKEIFDEFVVPTVICNGDDTPNCNNKRKTTL